LLKNPTVHAHYPPINFSVSFPEANHNRASIAQHQSRSGCWFHYKRRLMASRSSLKIKTGLSKCIQRNKCFMRRKPKNHPSPLGFHRKTHYHLIYVIGIIVRTEILGHRLILYKFQHFFVSRPNTSSNAMINQSNTRTTLKNNVKSNYYCLVGTF